MSENPYESPQAELGLRKQLHDKTEEHRQATPVATAMNPVIAAVSAVVIALAAIPALFLIARVLHALGIDMGAEIADFDQVIPLALLMVGSAATVIYLRFKSYRRKS